VTNNLQSDQKVLIISWSPVPTPKYQKIEGSGQRFFGLATGLQKNGIKDITIAVGSIYPLDVDSVFEIKLFNYDFNDEFVERLSEYDTIILNYAIHGAAFITKNIPSTTQVIFDVYGPAYIESLARDPEDLVGTYIGNLSAVNDIFNKILPRGDYFLYANDPQEKFYTGVLATLGIINQFSYKTDRLLKVPFGIDVPQKNKVYDDPYLDYGIKRSDFTLLWFGGLYPWFDITKILETVKNDKSKKIKFVIVGGNNPQNQHPDFVKHYKNVVRYIEDNHLKDRVVLIDWVDFATRRMYYEHADAIISMNGEGKENQYSWRTRVMDYVGSKTPLITNGGDPLSDELLEIGAAFRIDATDSQNIADLILDLLENGKKLFTASEKMQALQPKYYWQTVTKVLAEKIKTESKPYADERAFRQEHSITASSIVSDEPQGSRRSVIGLSRLVLRKVKEKGFKTTYTIAKHKVRNKLAFEYRKRVPKKVIQNPKIVIVSNQLNNTGAPFVIMDVVSQLKEQYPKLAKKIKFITFTPIDATNVLKLNQEGIDVEVYTNRELPVAFNNGDVVVFNTFAISRTTMFSALHAINEGKLRKIFWYGHEAAPDSFVEHDVRDAFTKLLNENKAKVYAVSEKTKQEYVRFFGTSTNIEKMLFRFLFPENKFKVRKESDFNELRFISTGSLMDMRKGQYPILYAFLDFYHNRYKKNPSNYRTFRLEFIGAFEKSDLSMHAPYHIQNIMKQLEVSAEGLGDHFSILPGMSRENAWKAIEEANVTICYSLLEAMGIFVYEGMATGHPIIRNDSAGREEQLREGKNGYGVSNNDFAGLVDVIEKLLNKKTTSNADLVKMSKLSNEIAKKATKSEYQIIDELAEVFKN
jgi:glycosyltransferase involved in cell wall biosynthesis